MIPLVAALTLAAAQAEAGAPSIERFAAVEHVFLPAPAGRLTLRVDALARAIVLEAPRDAAAISRAVRASPRTFCLGLEETPEAVRLTCGSNKIVARLVVQPSGVLTLDVRETRGLPWGGETAAPFLAFEPPEVGLGSTCPGSTPAGRAECRLAARDVAGARAELAGAEHVGAAALRLGDLALADGDPSRALSYWEAARGVPWERLAAARLCELSLDCLRGPAGAGVYVTEALPASAERDLLMRRARALAFLERPLDGARLLLATETGRAACAAASELCRRIALAALRLPDPAGAEALALWLRLPSRDRSLYELEVATARAAEQAGAPLFAANVLAGAAGLAPASALSDHLLHTAELYLQAGDLVRATVVYDFARARAGKRGPGGARWMALARGMAARRRRTASATSTSTAAVTPTFTGHRTTPHGDGAASAESTGGANDDALLAAANRAAAQAREHTQGRRP